MSNSINFYKNNVEWTEEHVSMLEKNGVQNIANVLVQCKHLKFPTVEQIEKAEKELAKLDKHKTKFIHNPKQQFKKDHYKIKIKK